MNLFLKLWSCFFTWKVGMDKDSTIGTYADVLLGLSFGIGQNNTPGASNKALALHAERINKEYKIPLILQQEISIGMNSASSYSVIGSHGKRGKYLDTHEVIRQAVEVCKRNKWSTVATLAHPDHAWRVKMIVEKFGLKALVVNTANVPYDLMSTQKWTRSKRQFVLREIAVKLYFLLRGWI